MTKAQHVAFFLPNMKGGGAEKATAVIANKMASEGLRVDFILMKSEGEFLDDLSPLVRVVDLDAQQFMSSIPRFARYLRAEKPGVIYSQMFDTALFAAMARKLSGYRPKFVSTIHSNLSAQARSGDAFNRGRKTQAYPLPVWNCA